MAKKKKSNNPNYTHTEKVVDDIPGIPKFTLPNPRESHVTKEYIKKKEDLLIQAI